MNVYAQVLHPANVDGSPAFFTGHGLDDAGRVYESFLIDDVIKFFYADDGSEAYA